MKANRAGDLWLLWKLVVFKIACTLFAIYIFGQFSPFYDASSYLGDMYSERTASLFDDRTIFVGAIASNLALMIGELPTHLVFSVTVALTLVPIFLSINDQQRRLAWLVISLPSFAVWTSIVSKESISCAGAALMLFFWVQCLQRRISVSAVIAVAVGAPIYAFMRPHYFVGAAWLIMITWLLDRRTRGISKLFGRGTMGRLSVGILILYLSVASILILPFFIEQMNVVAETAISYFPIGYGRTDRHSWLGWLTTDDFWKNLWWGWLWGIIGPLPQEALSRPVLLPYMIEGVFIVILFITVCHKVFITAYACDVMIRKFLHKVLFFGLIPAVILQLILHAPFGMVNAGSAVRYRTGFEIFLTLAPILFWSVTARMVKTPK